MSMTEGFFDIRAANPAGTGTDSVRTRGGRGVAGTASASVQDGVAASSGFAGILNWARETFSENGLESAEDVVREGARELVSKAFFEPIFAMMREDPLRSDVVPLSAGEKMFGPLLHSEFAKRIVASGNFPLVDAVVRSLLPNSVSAKEAPDGGEGGREGKSKAEEKVVQVEENSKETKSKIDVTA